MRQTPVPVLKVTWKVCTEYLTWSRRLGLCHSKHAHQVVLQKKLTNNWLHTAINALLNSWQSRCSCIFAEGALFLTSANNLWIAKTLWFGNNASKWCKTEAWTWGTCSQRQCQHGLHKMDEHLGRLWLYMAIAITIMMAECIFMMLTVMMTNHYLPHHQCMNMHVNLPQSINLEVPAAKWQIAGSRMCMTVLTLWPIGQMLP